MTQVFPHFSTRLDHLANSQQKRRSLEEGNVVLLQGCCYIIQMHFNSFKIYQHYHVNLITTVFSSS